MINQLSSPVRYPSGNIIALDIPLAEFMETFDEAKYEWINGTVIQISPTSVRHIYIQKYLQYLLDAYLSFNPIGQIFPDQLAMQIGSTFRVPDVVFLLNESLARLTANSLQDPAEICIEIVSPESVERDYGDKFAEYEAGGVREYWIIDLTRQQTHFYRLNANNVYERCAEDEHGNFTTPLLPKFSLDVPRLWQEHLPTLAETVSLVKAMLD